MADNCKRTAPTITVMESSPSSSLSTSSSSSSSSSSAIMFKRRRTACLAAACPLHLSSPDVEEVEDLCHSFKSSSDMSGGSSVDSGDISYVTCCSCNEEASKVVDESSSMLDLEANGFKTKDSMYTKLQPFSEVSGDSDEVELREESFPALPSRRRNLPSVRMPPQDEIEEFFSVAEKYEQKRFARKYNFDVVNDAPLEGGRYQWVRLPGN